MEDERELVPEPHCQRTPPPPGRPPAPPASSEPEDARTSPWEALIIRGKERGYVTDGEIRAVFDQLDQVPPGDLRRIHQMPAAMGIDVVADATSDRRPRGSLPDAGLVDKRLPCLDCASVPWPTDWSPVTRLSRKRCGRQTAGRLVVSLVPMRRVLLALAAVVVACAAAACGSPTGTPEGLELEIGGRTISMDGPNVSLCFVSRLPAIGPYVYISRRLTGGGYFIEGSLAPYTPPGSYSAFNPNSQLVRVMVAYDTGTDVPSAAQGYLVASGTLDGAVAGSSIDWTANLNLSAFENGPGPKTASIKGSFSCKEIAGPPSFGLTPTPPGSAPPVLTPFASPTPGGTPPFPTLAS